MVANKKNVKILMTRSLLPVDQKYIISGLQKIVGNCFEIIAPCTYTEEDICKAAVDVDVLLGSYVSKKVLDAAPNLKLIQIPWTGTDTFNFSAMKQCNIPVCNSHSNAAVVAELCVTLVADLIKKVSYHDRKMRAGNWNRDKKPLNLESKMISKQTICILGYGNIGRKIGKIFSAFGSTVLSVSMSQDMYPEVDESYSTENMMEAVQMANIVINALPLTDTTKGMINAEFVSYMPEGSYLVNISRAAIIEEDAIYKALLSGHLAGFASDVWWNEPKRGETLSWPSANNKFEELDQVIMSPHRAGFVEGALPHLDDVIVNLAHFINGEQLINIVNIKDEF